MTCHFPILQRFLLLTLGSDFYLFFIFSIKKNFFSTNKIISFSSNRVLLRSLKILYIKRLLHGFLQRIRAESFILRVPLIVFYSLEAQSTYQVMERKTLTYLFRYLRRTNMVVDNVL